MLSVKSENVPIFSTVEHASATKTRRLLSMRHRAHEDFPRRLPTSWCPSSAPTLAVRCHLCVAFAAVRDTLQRISSQPNLLTRLHKPSSDMLSFKMYYTAMTAAALLLSNVNAHGYLGLPAVTFPNDVDKTQFIATIESSASGFSGSFSGSPAENTAAFWTAFNSSQYSSIKEFVTDLGQIVANGANIECGLTDPDETPQPLPDELEWTHSDTEGFTSSHEGPCEAWCDNTRVFQDTDCAAHYTTAPAKMPYDKAGCSGASRLTFIG